MIKYLILDGDGVLYDAKDMHYETLNKALEFYHYRPISYHEHVTEYDGLSTDQKLEKLLFIDRINFGGKQKIATLKQQLTEDYIDQHIKFSSRLTTLVRLLKENYHVKVCSNAKRSTCIKVLGRLGLYKVGDPHSLLKINDIISNDDMIEKKPSSRAYLTCLEAGWEPNECLVIEDSYKGTESAKNAGMHVLNIRNSNELSYELIQNEVRTINKRSTVSFAPNFKNVNVLIPMSGHGKRFKDAGYELPKPLIDVNGRPMIARVIENLNMPNAQYSFIVLKEHEDKYAVSTLLKALTNSPHIFLVDKVTEGAACSALLAKEAINNDQNLVIANSDQIVDWNSFEFLYESFYRDLDANIAVFHEQVDFIPLPKLDPCVSKWSYAKLGDNNLVMQVAEKYRLSCWANTGIFFWKKGSEFVRSAEQMIKRKSMVNNEYFISPTLNELIAERKRVGTYEVKSMSGIGTPEDLTRYLNESK